MVDGIFYNSTPRPPTWNGFDSDKMIVGDDNSYTAKFTTLQNQEVMKNE